MSDRYTAPDFASCALVTIDTQVDVLDGGPLEIPGTTAVLGAISRLAGAFRAAGRPVVHVVRIYERDGSNVDLCRRALVEDGAEILAPGAPGTELARELVPHPAVQLDAPALLAGRVQHVDANEAIVHKPRWGAFYETPLQEHLDERGVTTLVFCGCNFPNCPRTSIYEASERDFRVVLARDAISGIYERGERELAAIGVVAMDTDEVVAELGVLAERAPSASRA